MPEIDHRLDSIQIEERLSLLVMALYSGACAGMVLFTALLVAVVSGQPSDGGAICSVLMMAATTLLMVRVIFTTALRWTARFDGRYLTIERRFLHRREQERIPLAAIREVWLEEEKRRVRVEVGERQLELGRRSASYDREDLHDALRAALARSAAVGTASDVPDPLRDLVERTS